MPSTVPAVKTGLRAWLAALPGLTPTDQVAVRSAPVAPEELMGDRDHVILGEVTAPQAAEYQGGRTERPSLTAWVIVTRPGSDEPAMASVRDRAYALLAVAETALVADPVAAGLFGKPDGAQVTETALTESAVDLDGSAGRQAQVRWTLGWGSDL